MSPILPPTIPRLPARIVESAWLEHGPFAFWLINALQPRLTVELGSHRGYSLCCFCEQLTRSGLDGRVIAVDTWSGDEHAGSYGDDIYVKLKAYVSNRYPNKADLKRMYFADALATIADGSVDLLHVDGRHYYDDVVEDFTSYIPKLSDRAVVLFHDTQVRDRNFGVYKYWAELVKQYPAFEFHHGYGLGVLGFGKNIPADVQALFAAGADPLSAAATRAAFAKHGRYILNYWQMREYASDPIRFAKTVGRALLKRG